MKIVLFGLASLLFLLAACGGSSSKQVAGQTKGGGRILVAAAADLRFAFEELKPLFEQECKCQVEMSFGSSGNFAAQIEQGLPADIFFSANMSFIDRLESKGLIIGGTKQLYATGRIVLAKNAGVSAKVDTLQDLLSPAIRKVSIANPQHAPYGVAAQEALTKAGLWDAIQARLVLGENASQATQFVETGDAQAGIIPLSLATQLKDKLSYVLIDESQHNRLSQGTAVLSRSRDPELAKRFLAFVNGPSGRAVLSKYGFLLPGE